MTELPSRASWWTSGVTVGTDQLPRCPWGASAPEFQGHK